MKHPERVEDYLGHIAEAIERATRRSSHTVDSTLVFPAKAGTHCYLGYRPSPV